MDIHGRSKGKLKQRDSNPGIITLSPGGVARNIAEILSRLEINCHLISAVGNDAYGQQLISQGQAQGIDMDGVVQTKTQATSCYVSIVDDSGDMLAGISDTEILQDINAETLSIQDKLINTAQLIILETNLSNHALDYLCTTYTHKTLFVDTVSTSKATRINSHLASIHTLKTSLNEAESLSGFRIFDHAHLPKLARWFHERGLKRIFVTLGDKGCYYSDGLQQGLAPALKSKATNTAGAGDTLFAALAYAWLANWPLLKSVQFAQRAALLNLSHAATIHPSLSLATIQDYYQQHYEH